MEEFLKQHINKLSNTMSDYNFYGVSSRDVSYNYTQGQLDTYKNILNYCAREPDNNDFQNELVNLLLEGLLDDIEQKGIESYIKIAQELINFFKLSGWIENKEYTTIEGIYERNR